MEKSSGRLKLLALFVALMFAALSTRLWFLQVLASERLKAEGSNNTVRIVHMEAPRGRILDANGKVIVGNRPSLEVTANLQQLAADSEGELLRLSELLHVPVNVIRTRLASKIYYDYQPKPIAFDVSENAAAYIKEHQDPGNNMFPGVDVVEASVRDYPNGDLAAHILGATGLIRKDQINDPAYSTYGSNDTVGQSGLESVYERYLRGQKGTDKYVVNAAGKLIRILGSQAPVPGDDLKLNLDLNIQSIAERALKEGIYRARGIYDEFTRRDFVANAGAVVVLDPQTFGVKAIASWPTFNPTWFEKTRLSKKQSKYVNDARLAPLYNRATQAELAPGSTFKPFVALAALKEGIASLGGSYYCSGSYFYPTDPAHVFNNWDAAGAGFISLTTAIRISCDTVFYRLGAAFYNRFDRQNPYGGTGPYEKDLHGLGFGRPTGIDVPDENAGVIPDPAWKADFAAANPKLFTQHDAIWLPGDEILMSIGQGYVQVTPLQLAAAYAAIANGGHLCDPRIAQRVQTEQGKPVKSFPAGHCQKLPYTAQQLSYIRTAMDGVTKTGGTAGLAFSGFPFSQVSVGGKTGTAERPGFGAGQDTSWFAALAGPPGGKTQYVIVVMVEQGGHGSTTAAPIARSIIEQLYGLQGAHNVNGGAND